MQTVATGWTAEERDSTRKIIQSTQVSWHKQSTLGNRTFTIGVSTIGGNDAIGINPGAIGSPANYKYFDESQYVMSINWERGLNMPTGGLTKALAEVRLDNTSERFTPNYMGGRSELYTAILPRRPILINAGFNYNGIDQTIPQFAGVLDRQPNINRRNREAILQAADYVDYFNNKYLDQSAMYTSLRTDQVMSTLLGTMGMNTAQYDLDYGINVIPFGMFDVGTKMSDIFNSLAESENGHFYQDESGIFKFRNRQWGDSSPWNTIQRIILTGQVIDAETPTDDHIINVVEINSSIYAKQQKQAIYSLSAPLALPKSTDTTLFVSFDDPVLALDTPNLWQAYTASDRSGTDISSSIILKSISKFAKAAKIVFSNISTTDGFLTDMTLYGRVARIASDLHYRSKDDSSVTAYQERILTIDNPYIQNISWAQSYAQMILNDFSDIDKIQTITIRALPELQLGDLVSWQGRYWRIYNIASSVDPSQGYTQVLTMVQRTLTTYFRIGISTIGSSDKIAP